MNIYFVSTLCVIEYSFSNIQLFQLLVVIRHLSLNNPQHQTAHDQSTQLLHQFNFSRLGSLQSIRVALAKQSGVFGSSATLWKNVPRHDAVRLANYATRHCYVSSTMDIMGVNDYFQFNRNGCRSYPAVINKFGGSWLDDDYIPDATSIPHYTPIRRKGVEVW